MTKSQPHIDVALIHPGVAWMYDPFEHLGLGYLAAGLRREGFRVIIIDAALERLSARRLCEELERYEIGVLGVTLLSHGYPTTVELLKYYRQRHPRTRIVAGGHFATFAAEKIFAHTDVFDAIVPHEGDDRFVDYCRVTLRGIRCPLDGIAVSGRMPIPPRNRIHDLDRLPFPVRDKLPLAVRRGTVATVTASRGCYARCGFCSLPAFYRAERNPGWVARSIDNVIEELRYLNQEFSIREFMFVDDNFIGPGTRGKEYALAFAAAYRKAGLGMSYSVDCRAQDVDEDTFAAMQDAGLRSVFLGIESVSQHDLDIYRKGVKSDVNRKAVKILRKCGLRYTLAMILFHPETNRTPLRENIEFLQEIGYYPRNPVSILNLYEGTELAERYSAVARGPFWDRRFDFKQSTTKEIYHEAKRFCEASIPLERSLSQQPDRFSAGRSALYRMRLQYLADVVEHVGKETLQEIRCRWEERLRCLCESLQFAGLAESRLHAASAPEPWQSSGGDLSRIGSNALASRE